MKGLLRNTALSRLLIAAIFFAAATVMIGASLLREPLAIMSPTGRSRTAITLALVQPSQSGTMAASARELARRDPLQSAAFVLLGIDRLRHDKTAFDSVKPLMDAAVSRQPTLEAPKVWLAADLARRGDYQQSLQLFDEALSQSSIYAEPLMPALSTLLKDAPSRAAVVKQLQAFPPWRTAVLDNAITANILPRETVESLLAGPAPARYRLMLELERQQYLGFLVGRGESAAAHALYRRYVGLSASAPLYDGQFRAEHPYRPFGWTLADQPEDYSERVARQEGGWMARLHSSGKRGATLLEQTVALGQGNWQAQLAARDGGLASPKALYVIVECLGEKTAQPIASTSLAALKTADDTVTLRFAVPSACPLQRLAVKAEANDGAASEIEVLGVRLSPA